MAASGAGKVLRFPGMPSEAYMEWLAQEDERRTVRLAAEREYINLSLGWKSGHFLYALAREGVLGPYAIAFRGTEDAAVDESRSVLESTRYIPREDYPRGQPRTPQEAIAAVRAEEAREIALLGEPDNYRRMVYVASGDRSKISMLLARADRAAKRQRIVWELINRSVLRPLWPVWRWRRRRLMRKEWTD